MTRQRARALPRVSARVVLWLAVSLCFPAGATERLRFSVQLAPELSAEAVSGRLLVFMTAKPGAEETLELDFLDPRSVWVAARELRNLAPGKSVEFDPDVLAFPEPLSAAPAGEYRVMALLDLNHSFSYNGIGEGDLRSKVVSTPIPASATSNLVTLSLSTAVPGSRLSDSDSIKLVTFESPALSAFWGRPIRMQAAIVLPPGYGSSGARRYPAVFSVHGYGGSHASAWQVGPDQLRAMSEGKRPEMITIYLDGSWPLGHHEFADSVNNGPWGRALTRELIPYLESKFRMDALPSGRLLTGHSSGGWASLWLQITYPDLFGGTWSTAPDPVDFRAFTGPDLTRYPPRNFYHGPDGRPYNLVRVSGRERMTLQEYALQERVLGDYGGQLASFEAVFSPRGPDGRPMPLFDRDTGRIEAQVQKAWGRFDIAGILRANWTQLGPKLSGKIHIFAGTADTFHLEQAVYLLRDALKSLGSDAKIEFIEGRDHFDLYAGGLEERIAREMYAVARPVKKAAAGGSLKLR